MLGEAHDRWLRGIGADIDKLRAAAGSGAPPTFNLSIDDPGLQSALVDTVVEFGKGFGKGVVDTSSGIVNSPAGQLVSVMVNPMAPLAARAVNAAVTGDPNKLAPDPGF